MSTPTLMAGLTLGLALAASGPLAQTPPTPPSTPTSIDTAMLYRSFVQDAPDCAVTAQNGKIAFADGIYSPAATCPDAFAWSQFLEAIDQEFWNWGIDQTAWPAKPLPICTAEVTTNCCPQDILDNPGTTPNDSCPYNRAAFDPVPPLPVSPNGTPSGIVVSHRGAHKKTPVEEIDPGRLLRDLEVELVFRNPVMIEDIFKNDLYSKEGLGARLRAANAAVSSGDIGTAQALQVRLSSTAVMVKADFLHQNILEGQGLIEDTDGDPDTPPNNPDHPYLTVYLEGTEETTGYYYLLAMTNASKALPIWHWYAMEHVSNLGRCDYIGCNDSFGYSVDETSPTGAKFGGHYIPPMQTQQNDKAVTPNGNPNDPIFVTGLVYDPATYGETMTTALSSLFDGMGVATDPTDSNPRVISATDPQWRNYRLKGTQTTFTTSTGVPTGLGATITEGGFVNSASCTTCHAQASTDLDGNPGAGGAIGASWRLNLFGFGQVEMGSPDLNWFFNPGTSAPYTSVQTDFMWGILNASCITPGSGDDGACASYPSAPTILD
ncbi:MAG: hypothetical protein AAFU59_00800 [Pseudomonadota bacterium]